MRLVAGVGRDQRDRSDRESHTRQRERAGSLTEAQAPCNGDDRGDDRGERRDDAHPSECETLVEEGDRDHADHAGDDPDDDVVARRVGVAIQADDGDDEHRGERVRQEDDPEDGHTPGGESAEEVARAVGERDDEPEKEGHQPCRTPGARAGRFVRSR